jgi:DNA-binding NarL/FixJ family response regulator
MEEARIRLLIVDSYAIMRKGLGMILRLEPDFDVIGEVENGRKALDFVHTSRPDIVLLDLIMPDMDGLATAMALRSVVPKLRVLVLTGAELNTGFPKILTRILSAGIKSFVPRDATPDELVQAVRTVAQGDIYIHPSVSKRFILKNGIEHELSSCLDIRFTPREQEVLCWMATPSTYREIADHLMLSEETVRSHAKKILNKLRQPNRFQAVLEAFRAGLIDLSQ